MPDTGCKHGHFSCSQCAADDWLAKVTSQRDAARMERQAARAGEERLQAYVDQLAKDIEQSGTPEAGLRTHGFHLAAALIDLKTAEVARLRAALEQFQRCGARHRCPVCKGVVDAALAAKGGAT